MASRFKVRTPRYGVEIVEGLPGAGKSFFLVERMFDALIKDRRPVYTNLPLRFGRVRAYCRKKCGPKVADLIQQLDMPHWSRFLARAAARQRYHDERRDVASKVKYEQVDRGFRAEFGEDLIEGPDANWIPAGALIIHDEVHHDYGMRDQRSEDPNLLTYLTMLRHHQHAYWCATQDRTRVTITIRLMVEVFWIVRNIKKDQIWLGIQFGNLGIEGFGYAAFTKHELEKPGMQKSIPFANYVRFAWLPWHQWKFTMYRSFSHAGDSGQLTRSIEEARVARGLTKEGHDPMRAEQEEKKRKRREGPMGRFAAAVMSKLKVAMLVAVFATMAYVYGRGRSDPRPPLGVMAGQSSVKESSGDLNDIIWPEWTSATGSRARLGSEAVEVGGRLRNGASLLYIANRPRRLLLEYRGDIWLWEWRAAKPIRLGSADEIEAIIAQQRASD